MWAQYADNSHGLCLCFDRERLVQAVRREFESRGYCLADDVQYSDHAPPLLLQAQAVLATGPVSYLLAHTEWFKARFLAKRPDWSGEHEFRIVVFEPQATGNYLFVPITGALAAIIVGDRFSDAYRPCIEQACKKSGVRAFRYLYTPDPELSPYA
jgi:hypothetical protein